MQKLPMQSGDPTAPPDNEERRERLLKIMRPDHPGCVDHKFCPRSEPIRVRGIEENYPLFAERRDMERKMAPISENDPES